MTALKNQGQWKPSQFNEYPGNIDGHWVVYNNLSGAMLEVTKSVYDSLAKNNTGEIIDKKGIFEPLDYGKLIVKSEIDEVEVLRKKRREFKDTSKIIGLQILPTMACNFNCS